MEDFVFELDTDSAKTAGHGGNSFGVLDTGIYDVTITTATLGKTKSGNNKVDLSIVTDENHETTIYQAFVLDKKWASGKDNFGYKDWQAFAVVSGMKSLTPYKKPLLKEDGSPVLKNEAQVILNAIKELDGVKIKLAIRKELDIYNGGLSEKNTVFASYTSAGASASEKLNNDDSATELNKLDGRLNDRKTNRYKAWEADGGAELSNNTDTGSVANDLEEEIDL